MHTCDKMHVSVDYSLSFSLLSLTRERYKIMYMYLHTYTNVYIYTYMLLSFTQPALLFLFLFLVHPNTTTTVHNEKFVSCNSHCHIHQTLVDGPFAFDGECKRTRRSGARGCDQKTGYSNVECRRSKSRVDSSGKSGIDR